MVRNNGGNAELVEILRQMLELNQNNQNHVHDPVGEMFKKISQSKPSTYDGTGEPTVLENWIREFDKLFEVLHCPENLRIDNVVFFLRDEADFWWIQNGAALR